MKIQITHTTPVSETDEEEVELLPGSLVQFVRADGKVYAIPVEAISKISS